MSKHATAGSCGAARRSAAIAASAGGWCSGASAVSSFERADDCVVDHHRVDEPRAAVHDAVAARVGLPERRERRLDVIAGLEIARAEQLVVRADAAAA